jgi:hypothetical protein
LLVLCAGGAAQWLQLKFPTLEVLSQGRISICMYVPVLPQSDPAAHLFLRAHHPCLFRYCIGDPKRRLSRLQAWKVLVESALLSWLSKVNSGMLDNFLACKCAPHCLPVSRAPASSYFLASDAPPRTASELPAGRLRAAPMPLR